jgi:hypothetical protein
MRHVGHQVWWSGARQEADTQALRRVVGPIPGPHAGRTGTLSETTTPLPRPFAPASIAGIRRLGRRPQRPRYCVEQLQPPVVAPVGPSARLRPPTRRRRIWPTRSPALLVELLLPFLSLLNAAHRHAKALGDASERHGQVTDLPDSGVEGALLSGAGSTPGADGLIRVSRQGEGTEDHEHPGQERSANDVAEPV